jgi:hypothetical protein
VCCRFRGYFNHAVCVWNCALLRRQKPVELGAETPPMLARYSHSYSRSRSGTPLFYHHAFARVDFSRGTDTCSFSVQRDKAATPTHSFLSIRELCAQLEPIWTKKEGTDAFSCLLKTKYVIVDKFYYVFRILRVKYLFKEPIFFTPFRIFCLFSIITPTLTYIFLHVIGFQYFNS